MKHGLRLFISIVLIGEPSFCLVVETSASTPTLDANAVYTQAAITVAAKLTQTAALNQQQLPHPHLSQLPPKWKLPQPLPRPWQQPRLHFPRIQLNQPCQTRHCGYYNLPRTEQNSRPTRALQ